MSKTVRYFTMKWNKVKDLWYLICRKNRFIQEFFDCANVHESFPDLEKEGENQYEVIIYKLPKEGEMAEGKRKHVVDIRARVTDDQGRLTYSKDITLGAMNLEDVIKVQAAVAAIESSAAAEQLGQAQ